MLANLQIVSGNGIPHPAHGVLLLTLYGTVGTHHLTIRNGIGEEALLFLSVVHTERGTYHEILEWCDTEVYIAKHTPLCIFVVFRISNHAQRILTL